MTQKILIKQNEEVTLPLLWLGDEVELSYNIILSERGAKLNILGLLLGRGQQELELKINVTHSAPDTKSEVILKGVLLDRAKINFEGLVNIEKGSKGTNTWLGSHLLLLSNQSRGRAIPSLEIKENDIKAGHAATVGKINGLEIFYLMSRGLSEREAKWLIVDGFLKSILNKFPDDLSKKAQQFMIKSHLEKE